MEKIGKCAEEQDNEYTIRGHWGASGGCQCFCIKACIKKRKPHFIIMYGKFWLDGDFFVRNLDASVELRQYQSLSQRNLFLILTEFFSSLFFPFFTKVLFRSWFFHKQRASTCEFYKVHDVNRIWKLHENRALTWAVAAKINSPRIFSQVRKKGTYLIYQLLFENTFLELTRLLLKISEYFFKKMLRWMF